MHCVFHSIRFKVNKGWSTAVLLFLCPYVTKFLLNIIYSTSLVSFSRFSKGWGMQFLVFSDSLCMTLSIWYWLFQTPRLYLAFIISSVSYDCTITMIHLHISVIHVIHLWFCKVKGMGDFTKFIDFIICNNIPCGPNIRFLKYFYPILQHLEQVMWLFIDF